MAETGELLGTARVSLVMDADQWDAEVQRARNRAAELGTTGEAAFNKLSASEKRATESALRMAQGFGKTREEFRLVELQARGALPAAIEKAREALERTRRSADQGAISLNKYGLSAKQNAAALRQVPAQLTDIFTGLAGGQNPLLVLLQQGGQLRDVFGGIVPAARALGGALLGLVNPATLTAAAVIGLVAVWEKGAEQAHEFERALILTGNAAGTTADALAAQASELDDLAGVTQGKAASALAQVANTGQFTADQIEMVTRAALQMEAATGKSVEDTIAEFVKLKKDPVDAILALNDQMHFLSEAQLEQIQSLKDAGRESDAAAAAFKAYAAAIEDRAPRLREEVGLLGGAFRGMGNAAAEAWDSVISGIQDVDREAKQGLDSLGRLMSFFRGGAPGGIFGLRAALSPPVSVAPQASTFDARKAAKDAEERKKAQESFDRMVVGNLSKQARLEREIDDIRKAGLKAGKSEVEIEKAIADARARYAESLPKERKRKETDPTEAIIQRLRQQIALNEEQVKSEDKLTATERLLVQIRTDLEKIGDKGSKTNKALIQTLLGEAKASGEAAEAAMREAKAKEALARQNAILEAQSANRARSNELDLMQFGRGADAVAQLRRQLEIEREYQDELKRLGDRGVAEDKAAWDAMAANAARHREQELSRERAFQEQRLAVMGDWRTGATAAMEDFIFEANNLSSAWYDVWSDGLNGLSQQFVQLATTGKASFKDLAKSILEEITKLMLQRAVAQFITMIASLFAPGSSGTTVTGGSSLGYTPAAKGKAFDGAGIVPFAKGGAFTNKIVSSPTLFPFAKGTGLMGEAGPEAIMPLKRMSNGKLGVESTGGGSGPVNVTTVVNVSNERASSSTNGNNDAVGRALSKEIEGAVIRVLTTQMRQGGILWKQQVGA